MSERRWESRSAEDLRKMLTNHLRYELSMVQWTASAIGGRSWAYNAVLESFLLHARNLRGFFYGQERRNHDDVLAIHYFHSADTWVDARPPEKTLTTYDEGDWSFLLNKHLAHLTWARQDESLVGWKVSAMHDDLLRVWKEFERLSRHDRPELWREIDDVSNASG